jgi:hypothetical protein
MRNANNQRLINSCEVIRLTMKTISICIRLEPRSKGQFNRNTAYRWLILFGLVVSGLCNLRAQQPLQGFYPPPPSSILRLLGTNDVLGNYQRAQVLGSTNIGSIIPKPGSPTLLMWTNNAGNAWTLTPDFTNHLLGLGADSSYNGQSLTLIQTNGVCTGLCFPGDAVPYNKSGVQMPVFGSTLLNGYASSRFANGWSGSNYGAGMSFYTTMWSLLDKPLSGFQVGEPGTWWMPNNGSWTLKGFLQTLEGSPGFWSGTAFPTTWPKYRMNGTYDKYGHQLCSPGFGFNDMRPQAANVMGLAQLSNRILVPPDGFTLGSNPNGAYFGNAWMALPMTPATNTGATNAVRDQSWTFFINSKNFSGPVAFYVADIYERWAQQVNTNALGRGMDTKPGHYSSLSMEIGGVPALTQTSGGGQVYARVPRLLFPTNGGNLTYLGSEAKAYSRAALYEDVQSWFNGGSAVSGMFQTNSTCCESEVISVSGSPPLKLAREQIYGLDGFVKMAAVTTPRGASAYAWQWGANATPGVFPEYYQQTTNGWNIITRAQLPADVMLPYANFKPATVNRKGYYPPAPPDPRRVPAPSSPNITVRLTDGSQVTYCWYKFIDQPSLQGFAWSAAQKQQLQSRVEKLQAAWSTNGTFMPPPRDGALATLDPALLVTPPAGLEIGYVPWVVSQSAVVPN